MTRDQKLSLLEHLKDWFTSSGMGLDPAIEEKNHLLTLQVDIPLQENNPSTALMEISPLDYSDSVSIVQIFTTVFSGLTPAAQSGLLSPMPMWNLTSLAGTYGIFEYTPQKYQLYHRYTVPLMEGNMLHMDDQAQTVFLGVCMAWDEMCKRIDTAVEIVSSSLE